MTASPGHPPRPPRPTPWVLLAYGAVTILFGYPLLLRLGDAVPVDLGDPLLNTWILWWNAQALPLTTRWWNAPAFFPAHDALAFSEHLAGLSPLTSPLIWFSGNPLLAYSVAFLLTFLLSALGAYVLALTITRRHDAAFVAGLAYGFAPYRMAQISHLQVLASFWMPLALACLHRYVADRRPRWLVLFAAATALQGLTNGYYLFFFPVLVALWALWFAPRGRLLVTMGGVGAGLAAAALPVLPFLLHYRAVHSWYRFERFSTEISRFSAHIDDLLRASPNLILWGSWLGTSSPERQLFPGLTSLLVIGSAALLARKSSEVNGLAPGGLPRSLRLTLIVVASVVSLVALSRVLIGPWRLELAGVALSTGQLSKPLTVAAWAWSIVMVAGPWARRVAHSRSPLAFYTLAAAAMWILSFGPAPAVGDLEVLYWAPYRWLSLLPGFGGLRVPARFAMLAVLCLSSATALGLARLQSRRGRRAGFVLVGLASAGLLAEGWREVPLLDPPSASVLSPDDEPGAVIELPLGSTTDDVQAMYRGVEHRHPVVNGYSGYEPAHIILLRLALPSEDPRLLRELAARGVRYVVVVGDRDRSRRWRRYVRSLPGTTRVRAAADQVLFTLPAPAPSPVDCEGQPLPVAGLTANVSPDSAPHALDGDPDTRWYTGRPQQPGDEVIVDLGVSRVVKGVEIALGPHYGDYPRRLVVEASSDAGSVQVLWSGPTSAAALAAAVEAPRRMPLRVCFTPTKARLLRLRQVGHAERFGWTITELEVLGVGSRPGPLSTAREDGS